MRLSINSARAIGLILLVLGAAGLVAATVYSSSIPALISLGLIAWGIIIFYIQSDEYVKQTILNSTSITLLTALDETLSLLDYMGKAIYLPPKYLNDPQSTKIYIPKLRTGTLPSPDTTQKLETQPNHRNSQGLLITAPGAELAQLLETELGTSFLRVGLKDLPQKLLKTLIEDLEIMTHCEIQTSSYDNAGQSHDRQMDQNAVFVKFSTTVYKDTCKRATQLPMIFSNIGCPLSSALAIVFTKATGKPIVIETQHTSENGETNEIRYMILEEQVL